MASITRIMKDILYNNVIFKSIMGHCLYYETPPSFIMKVIIMKYFKLMNYVKLAFYSEV